MHLGPIERLPTEILEIIFFNCLSLSLPQASLTLGSTLSSFYVKARLFEMVFSRSIHKMSHADELEHIFNRAEYWTQDVASLQNELLKLRWVTVDFFRRYLPFWLEKTIGALPEDMVLPIFIQKPRLGPSRGEVPRWEDKRPPHSITSSGDRREAFARLFRKEIKLVDVMARFKDHTAAEINIVEYRELDWRLVDSDELPIMERTYRWATGNKNIERDPETRRILRCLQGCYIPAKHLGGPWTKDRCHLVHMLSSAGAKINVEDPTNREIATQGFFAALKKRDLRILRHLLRSLSPGPEHLAYAVVCLGCPKKIVKTMISRLRAEGCVIYEATLFEWADQKEAEGNRRGRWLLDTLDRFAIFPSTSREIWVYVLPQDPNSSPGSFKYVSPAFTDGPWCRFGQERYDRPKSFGSVFSSLESHQHDRPPL